MSVYKCREGVSPHGSALFYGIKQLIRFPNFSDNGEPDTSHLKSNYTKRSYNSEGRLSPRGIV